MKKPFILCGVILVVLFFVSCKKLGKRKEFDLNYTEDITIPANNTILSLPFDIRSPETTTNSNAEYKNQGTSSKLVESVTLSKLTLKVKSPQSENFDFLNSIEIYISSANTQETLLASKNNIPENGLKELDLDVCPTNLKNFLQDDSFILRVKTVTDKTIYYDLTITTDEILHVKARLRNVFK